MLAALKNRCTKAYFLFLSHCLKIINSLNVEFQGEGPMVQLLLPRLTLLLKTILKCYIKKDVLDSGKSLQEIDFENPSNHLDLNKMFVGTACEIFLNKEPEDNHTKDMRRVMLFFYIEISKQIKKRFNLDDPTLKYFNYFDPNVAVSGYVGSIVCVLDIFPSFLKDAELINDEWRQLSDIDMLKDLARDNKADKFWYEVGAMKNGLNVLMFGNIAKLAKTVLSLPHSTATVERKFSQQNLIKNSKRNHLSFKTTAALMKAKDVLKYGNGVENTCINWEPSKELLKNKIIYKENVSTDALENN